VGIQAGSLRPHTRALRFYEKVGFRREGVQREGYYYNHHYYDFVMMRILEQEFRALQVAPSQPLVP
jgi:diamine N-acetyltransferase